MNEKRLTFLFKGLSILKISYHSKYLINILGGFYDKKS